MSDLTRLPHNLDDAARTCRAVVETPEGRRCKFDYDPDLGAFTLKRLLPDGMAFPLDFGFVPATRAEDGDPLDILVLTDEPTAMGVVLEVRLIGVIEAEQSHDGKTNRNDRLVGVSVLSRLHKRVKTLDDLGEAFVTNLSQFWVNYNALTGRAFRVLRVADAQAAVELIRSHER